MRAHYRFLKTKRGALLALVILSSMLVPAGALASSVLLDPTFDTDGKVTTLFGTSDDKAYAIGLQPDGKIVAAGFYDTTIDLDFALARYNSNGSLDTTFGSSGRRSADWDALDNVGQALAIQPDGKIIVVGYTPNPAVPGDFIFALVRYINNGSPDTTFSGDGKTTTDFGIDDRAYAIALQPDGKIVVAGYTYSGSDSDFILVRYNGNGSLDTTFSIDGITITNFNFGNDTAHAVAIQPDSKIVVAGYSSIAGNSDFALARYNSDGSLDTTFSGDGKTTTSFGGGSDTATALVIQPDGRIVVVGDTFNLTTLDQDFALARYNSDGSPDTTFSADGKTTTSFGSGRDLGTALALQPDGKIIVAGRSHNGADYDFALARYNTNGSPDVIFDGDGKVTTPVGTNFDYGQALALQPDGKIIVAGYTDTGTSYDFALVRYNGDTATFADVPTNYWAWNWIERLYIDGITGGCAINPIQYCPEASVTRAQMAVFLERGKNGPTFTPPPAAGTVFADVPLAYWAAAWIEKLATDGITTGCGGGNYCPEQPVTRAQMAVFLLRAKYGAGYTPPGVGAGTGFGDVQPDYWAAAWIKQLVTEGITSGCGSGNYCPENPVTRAQMAVFLVRTFNLP
jgi:uncharacterized delta-60 repeat protein